jgi:hypothetical protein
MGLYGNELMEYMSVNEGLFRKKNKEKKSSESKTEHKIPKDQMYNKVIQAVKAEISKVKDTKFKKSLILYTKDKIAKDFDKDYYQNYIDDKEDSLPILKFDFWKWGTKRSDAEDYDKLLYQDTQVVNIIDKLAKEYGYETVDDCDWDSGTFYIK